MKESEAQLPIKQSPLQLQAETRGDSVVAGAHFSCATRTEP
jgi:hypothetical protein